MFVTIDVLSRIYKLLYACSPSKLDGVPRTQTSRVQCSYYSSRSHGTVVCTTTYKGRNYCKPRDPASWQKMAALSVPDDCERTATVALTDCQTGVLVDNHSSFAALDGFSNVFEPPLYRSKNGHTHTHTKIRTRTTTLPRYATPTRGNKLDGVPRTQTSRLLLSYYSSRSHGTVCM